MCLNTTHKNRLVCVCERGLIKLELVELGSPRSQPPLIGQLSRKQAGSDRVVADPPKCLRPLSLSLSLSNTHTHTHLE